MWFNDAVETFKCHTEYEEGTACIRWVKDVGTQETKRTVVLWDLNTKHRVQWARDCCRKSAKFIQNALMIYKETITCYSNNTHESKCLWSCTSMEYQRFDFFFHLLLEVWLFLFKVGSEKYWPTHLSPFRACWLASCEVVGHETLHISLIKERQLVVHLPTDKTNVSDTARADMYSENDTWRLCFWIITWNCINYLLLTCTKKIQHPIISRHHRTKMEFLAGSVFLSIFQWRKIGFNLKNMNNSLHRILFGYTYSGFSFSTQNVTFLYKIDIEGFKKFKKKVASSGIWTHNSSHHWIIILTALLTQPPSHLWNRKYLYWSWIISRINRTWLHRVLKFGTGKELQIGWVGKAVRILIQWWLVLWDQIPLGATLFFVETFQTSQCQHCSEMSDWCWKRKPWMSVRDFIKYGELSSFSWYAFLSDHLTDLKLHRTK